jgi:hypothetical protein
MQNGVELFYELFRWLRLAFGLLPIWQTPLALFAKWQNKKPTESKLVFVTICGDADGNGVLRNIAAQRAMQFVPPAKNRAPI